MSRYYYPNAKSVFGNGRKSKPIYNENKQYCFWCNFKQHLRRYKLKTKNFGVALQRKNENKSKPISLKKGHILFVLYIALCGILVDLVQYLRSYGRKTWNVFHILVYYCLKKQIYSNISYPKYLIVLLVLPHIHKFALILPEKVQHTTFNFYLSKSSVPPSSGIQPFF